MKHTLFRYFLRLFRAFLAQSDADGFENEVEIVKETALVLNIVEVHIDTLLDGSVASAVRLPLARQTLRNAETQFGFFSIGTVLSRRTRTRSDKRHVSFKNIDKLRQFVNRGFAQKLADFGDTRVVFELEIDFPLVVTFTQKLVEFFVGALFHRAEFVKFKDFSALSHSFGSVKSVSFCVDFDCNSHKNHRDCQYDHGKKGRNDIERSFKKRVGKYLSDLEIVDKLLVVNFLRRLYIVLAIRSGFYVSIRFFVVFFQ